MSYTFTVNMLTLRIVLVHKPAYICLGGSHLVLYHNTASLGSSNPTSFFPVHAAFVPSWLEDSPE